jgi:hypothetical protein
LGAREGSLIGGKGKEAHHKDHSNRGCENWLTVAWHITETILTVVAAGAGAHIPLHEAPKQLGDKEEKPQTRTTSDLAVDIMVRSHWLRRMRSAYLPKNGVMGMSMAFADMRHTASA